MGSTVDGIDGFRSQNPIVGQTFRRKQWAAYASIIWEFPGARLTALQGCHPFYALLMRRFLGAVKPPNVALARAS